MQALVGNIPLEFLEVVLGHAEQLLRLHKPSHVKVFRLVFSLNFLLLKSNQQILQGGGGLGELSQANLPNLGSAL